MYPHSQLVGENVMARSDTDKVPLKAIENISMASEKLYRNTLN